VEDKFQDVELQHQTEEVLTTDTILQSGIAIFLHMHMWQCFLDDGKFIADTTASEYKQNFDVFSFRSFVSTRKFPITYANARKSGNSLFKFYPSFSVTAIIRTEENSGV
jgi:hypothetical protein